MINRPSKEKKGGAEATSYLPLFSDELGLSVSHRGGFHHHSGDVFSARNLKHSRKECILNNGPQAAGSGLSFLSHFGCFFERIRFDFENNAFQFEQSCVLRQDRILRFGQNANQRFFVKVIQHCNHRETTDQLRTQAGILFP